MGFGPVYEWVKKDERGDVDGWWMSEEIEEESPPVRPALPEAAGEGGRAGYRGAGDPE